MADTDRPGPDPIRTAADTDRPEPDPVRTAADSDAATPAALLEALQTDIAAAAERHGWTAVAEAAAALPAPDDPTVLICASPMADAEALATDLRSRLDGIAVRALPLASLHVDDTPALHANRVVLALGCAELLDLPAAEAAAALATRPGGSVLVVLTGAEVLDGPEDLERATRRTRRMLGDGSGGQPTGHDPAAPGCLLWASDAPTSAAVRERLDEDSATLVDRLTNPGSVPPLLGAARAARLLDLAGSAVKQSDDHTRPSPAAAVTAEDARLAGRAASARSLLADGGAELLRRLAAETSAAESQAVATLEMLEQDLLRDLQPFLREHREELSDRARADRLIGGLLDRRVHDWAVTAGPGLRAHAARADHAMSSLYRDLDQALVGCGADPGTVGRPPVLTLDSALPTGAAAAPSDRGRSGGLTPQVVLGGVLGAAIAGAAVTTGVGTVLGAGVGAVAGGALRRTQTGHHVARCGERGRRMIRDAMAAATGTLSSTVRRESDAVRREVERTLERCVRTVDALVPATDGPSASRPDTGPEPGPAEASTQAAADLADLRTRLAAVL